ncbi:hypothetical protein GpartN1_g5186.t1 [Galdieria partita]|uniref:Magnesium transporter n=1 Tax=Galdieria partita TaxID=83374 RepID=A0A9C7PZN0_9RHOD|nr:hypothetical protein GpartN1_g5186.t1 [Galdieria partita]
MLKRSKYMERQAVNCILSQPFDLFNFGPKGDCSSIQASKEDLCELIFNAPTLPLHSKGSVSSKDSKLTVSQILRILRPSLPELCDTTFFQCFSQCLLLTRKDHFFAIILRDRLLLFVHNAHSSVSSILQEALQYLLYSDERHSETCSFCWIALSSLIVCYAEDLKRVFEDLHEQNTELLQRVKCVSDFINYKDIVLQRQSLQSLLIELEDFEQILLHILSLQMLHSVKVSNPVASPIHAILRIMDQMASRIHQRVEVSNQTEHWLMMESDAVQSQLLSFDVPLTFSAACFLLCFLFFAFTGMNTGIPIYHSPHAIDYWLGMILIVVVFLSCYGWMMTKWLRRSGPKLSPGQVPHHHPVEDTVLFSQVSSGRISFLNTLTQ